mmetsp:Transcript_24991/g.73094  ORF Transcript_24991/g.73094 Transcript_24991/m.73094 type:complete len:251 (-) Transcript_24991:1773-2525(-)
MAYPVAALRPSVPFILMYIQEMGKIAADPKGAAATAPSFLGTQMSLPQSFPEASGSATCPGRNGARCLATPMDPTPGPPPPCGMQNVLCRFKWHTSAPINPGLVRPTWAFMFAPSMYTWPPASCTASMTSTIPSSYTPKVEGYVTMKAATFSLCFSIFSFKSFMSTFPWSSLSTTTTFIPAMAADAGFVPCALLGMRHTFRWLSPIDARYRIIVSKPAYSPVAPEFGCALTAANPVISARSLLRSSISSW